MSSLKASYWAFNLLQLFSNYSECLYRGSRATLAQRRYPPPPFQRVICNAKCLHSIHWVDLAIIETVCLKYGPASSEMSEHLLKKKVNHSVCAQLQSGYRTSLIRLKDWSESISACLCVFECLVYIAAHDLHSVSLTLPHNTNLRCMSQLGSCTDASHNKKNSNKHGGYTFRT